MAVGGRGRRGEREKSARGSSDDVAISGTIDGNCFARIELKVRRIRKADNLRVHKRRIDHQRLTTIVGARPESDRVAPGVICRANRAANTVDILIRYRTPMREGRGDKIAR